MAKEFENENRPPFSPTLQFQKNCYPSYFAKSIEIESIITLNPGKSIVSILEIISFLSYFRGIFRNWNQKGKPF